MSPRRTIASYGPRRSTVRVFVEEDQGLVRVQWRERGQLRTKSWPNTTAGKADAKAWARGFAETRDLRGRPAVARLTLRALWEAYTTAEFPHLRESTQRLYSEAWRHWTLAWTAEFFAEDATPQMLDELRVSMEAARYATNTIRMTVRAIKTVHAFGEQRELLGRNRLAAWRFKLLKERRTESPAEYRGDEFTKIMAQLDPMDGRQWRAFVALAICGYQGVRQHSALHLQWPDVDFAAGRLIWRAQWDKTGREWSQPMRQATRDALLVAQARRTGDNPWVIPSPKPDRPLSIQSLWASLVNAERRAGIPHRPRRGGHGLRRMLAGDVAQMTGDGMTGLRAIGDRDPRQAERYLKDRVDVMDAVFLELDRIQTATVVETSHPEKSQDGP